jgi:hypothetical protein
VLVFVPANVWRSFITCQIVDVKRQPTSSGVNDFFWKKLLFRTDGSFPGLQQNDDYVFGGNVKACQTTEEKRKKWYV